MFLPRRAPSPTHPWRFPSTLPFIIGLTCGDLVLFALAVAGLAALAVALGPLFFLIKWAGIADLLYLVWRLWVAGPRALEARAVCGDPMRQFALGAVLPLGNPKAIGFYVALLPAVFDPTHLTWMACAQLAVIIAVIWTAVLYGYAYAGDRAGRLIETPRAQIVLNRCASGAMVGAAGTIAAQ